MTFYLDTSVVVALVTRERTQPTVAEWLATRSPGECLVSDWVLTEASSALSIKERSHALDRASRAVAERILDVLVRDVLDVVPVGRRAFGWAREACADPSLGLRASDALHLGVTVAEGAELCTRDAAQADAAARLGVPALMLRR